MVRVADCVPVLLADVEHRVVGAAHAGRPGLVAGIVPATVARMRDLGADRIVAWLGPHVCGSCYEVPGEMRDEVAAVVPEAYAETSWATPAVDVGAGVVAQLEKLGVEVVDASRCTLETEDLYSYRREGAAAGRLGGLVWVRPLPMTAPGRSRRDEIAGNLDVVRDRIASACAAAGREPEEITLTVVTKFFPPSDVRLLAELGVTDVGENRHQEAEEKVRECADLALRWHFIGGLQSNKAAAVAAYADVVESVDRAKLLPGLSKGAQQRGRQVDCLVQVSLDPPDAQGRAGAPPAEVPALADQVRGAEGLRLRGVMAVAPLGEDPAAAFARLADVAAAVRRIDPTATWVSAGMSADLEAAISAGATHVRIGSAVLGSRPAIK